MTVFEQLSSGLELMVIGMTVVFLFLGVLVITINLLARLVPHLGSSPVGGTVAPKPSGTPNAELIAVISAAVQRYKTTNR